VSSRNHPVCTKCDIGFKDSFEFADVSAVTLGKTAYFSTLSASQHGALEHPESHCYLCRWQFDSPEVLNNHIRHFVNHPKCADCGLRFPDAGTYQHVSLMIVTLSPFSYRHSTYSLSIARTPITRQLWPPRHRSTFNLKEVGFHPFPPPRSATRFSMASLLSKATRPVLFSLLPSLCPLA